MCIPLLCIGKNLFGLPRAVARLIYKYSCVWIFEKWFYSLNEKLYYSR